MRKLWHEVNALIGPRDAAALFSRDTFEPARLVEPGSLFGEWAGRQWAGTFRLVGGERTYRLTYDGRTWEVFA